MATSNMNLVYLNIIVTKVTWSSGMDIFHFYLQRIGTSIDKVSRFRFQRCLRRSASGHVELNLLIGDQVHHHIRINLP